MLTITNLKKITVKNEQQINSYNGFYPLGISSPKAMLLLNYLIWSKMSSCGYKYGGRYYHDDIDYLKGGGLFVKGKPQFTFNDFFEIGIYFNDTWKMSAYLRSSSGKAENLIAIKNKLAGELKYFWKLDGKDKENCVIPIGKFGRTESVDNQDEVFKKFPVEESVLNENHEKCIVISFEEYRCLYEFLRGRNKEKTIKKYGEEAYNKIIGKQIEDQFLISAIDVLKSEILKAINEYTEYENAQQKERDEAYNKIRTQYQENCTEAKKIRDTKIADLQKQMEDMKAMAFGMPTAMAS